MLKPFKLASRDPLQNYLKKNLNRYFFSIIYFIIRSCNFRFARFCLSFSLMLYPGPIARKKRRDERYTAKVRNEWRGINLRRFALRWSTHVARDDRSVPGRVPLARMCGAFFLRACNYYKSVSALATAAYKSRNGLKRGATADSERAAAKLFFRGCP